VVLGRPQSVMYDWGVADNLSAEDRRRTMRAVKSKGTGPERRLRAMLAARGFRGWRVSPPGLAGNPDFAFPSKRVAVFIDGCFWHMCPKCRRPLPVANAAYWRKKIAGNAKRDRAWDRELAGKGWRVVRIWEHELARDESLKVVEDKIRVAIEGRRRAG
jgi:DNA mismatch endonuclease (patch repair protein)